MYRWMSLLTITALFVTLVNAPAQNMSDDMFINRILTANHINDIFDMPVSERERINFVFGVGPRLFSLVLTYSDKDKVWQAIHHFRSMTDAGFTTSFEMDCFNAFKKNPFIFYDRYMAGDHLALDRMLDAMEAYLIDEGNICEKEKVNRKVLEMAIEKLEKMKANLTGPQKIKRHSIFVEEVNKKLIWREKTFKELFPDSCK
jgi:hypothetical protein